MSDDDDIPILTRVVRRERRAHPTLTPELREAVVARVTAQCQDTLADLVHSATLDINAVLSDTLLTELQQRLPTLVEAAVADVLAEAADEPGDGDG